MIDTAQLREALARILDNFQMSSEVGIPIARESEWEVAFKAAEERLAQKEAGALIITPDENGTCSMPLRNIGYEAREVEPQPCGMPGAWNLEGQIYCRQCVGYYEDALRDAMPDGDSE